MPETCIVSEQNKIGIISASGWLFKKKSITMHGNMSVKFVYYENIADIVVVNIIEQTL